MRVTEGECGRNQVSAELGEDDGLDALGGGGFGDAEDGGGGGA